MIGIVPLLLGMAAATEKAPTITYDPYTKTESIVGRSHLHNALFDLNKPTFWLQADVTNGVPHNPVIMYDLDTPDWYFLDSAADIDGQQLRVIQGNRDLNGLGSGVHEFIGVELTPDYLRAHRAAGMNIKLIGDRGSRILQIDPIVVTTFDDTYEREIAKFGGIPDEGNSVASPAATQQGSVAQTLAQTTSMLQARGMDAAKQGMAKGGYGFSFVATPYGVYVMAVAPGSRADAAGLKAGTAIVSINGNPSVGMTNEQVTSLLASSASSSIKFKISGGQDVNLAPGN